MRRRLVAALVVAHVEVCASLAWFSGAGDATVLHEFAANETYRYFSVLQFRVAGRAWPMDAFVVAKDALTIHRGHEHDRLVAWTGCEDGLLLSGEDCLAAAPIPLTDFYRARDANWAHNTAFAMKGDSLIGVGGRDGRRTAGHKRRDGVYSRSFSSAAFLLRNGMNTTDAQRAVLHGNHSGCVERRPHFAPECEFDGRFSLAARADGLHFLYARANVVGEAAEQGHFGGRHVQVATGASADGPWGPFALIRVPNFVPFDRDHNAYFGAVSPNPADGGETLVGLFPVRSPDFAAIGLGVTCDGVRFSPLVSVAGAGAAPSEGRTLDHPVDGWLVDAVRGEAYFYVHRNVPGIAPRGKRASLARVPVDLAALRALTERAYPQGCDAAQGRDRLPDSARRRVN